MSFVGRLGIDYKILIAQIINFLILLLILKHFLYQPLVKKIEERKKKEREIQNKLGEIDKREEEIRKREEEIIQRAKEKTNQIIEEGKEISEKEKKRILARAEEEMRKILKSAKERARLELEKARLQEKEEILEKAKKIVKSVLSESFTRELHRVYLEETIEDLKRVDLSKIRQKDVIQVTLISAFPLSNKERREVASFLFKKLGNSAFQETIDSNLIAGIRIQINGFLIDGSLKAKIEKLAQ